MLFDVARPVIEFENVVLDLTGFTLTGVPGSLHGITSPPFGAVTVRNGVVREWDGSGVSLSGSSTCVEDIEARENGGWGIDMTNGFGGTIHQVVRRCRAQENGAGVAGTGGVKVGSASMVSGCTIISNTGTGLVVSTNSNVFDNVISGTPTGGISASFSLLRANLVTSNANVTTNCPLVNNRGI